MNLQENCVRSKGTVAEFSLAGAFQSFSSLVHFS